MNLNVGTAGSIGIVRIQYIKINLRNYFTQKLEEELSKQD